jgi:RNA polymerase-binding transcription factor DksA
MAAKKITSKSAPAKGAAKPAVKPTKPATAAKNPAAKAASTEKAAKTPKAATPVKTPAAVKKPAVAKQVQPLKKAAAAPATPPAPVVEVKEAAPKAAAPAKKQPAVKPRSSVVDYPAPPAPVKPPFVPPKAAPAPTGEIATPGSNGSHSPAFIAKQRQRLLDLRDDLVDAVSGMARDTIRNAPEGSEASGSGQHQGDAGSDAYDRDFALSVLAKEQDALYEIEQALRRIQSGSYGICEMSTRKIPQARLEAIPFARLTVECQAQWEKEYGNRRFRPSNEVGFSGGKYAEDEDSETVSLDEDDD